MEGDPAVVKDTRVCVPRSDKDAWHQIFIKHVFHVPDGRSAICILNDGAFL